MRGAGACSTSCSSRQTCSSPTCARRAGPAGARRRDAARALPAPRLRPRPRLRGPRPRRRPGRLRRVGILGPRAEWPTSSRRPTVTTRSASAARWATATAPWRWPSAIAAALLKRNEHGRRLGRRRVAAGDRHVDAVVGPARGAQAATSRAAAGGRGPLVNPLVGTYRTKDGRHIQLVFLQADRYWADFCRLIGRDDLVEDPRFVDLAARRANSRMPACRPRRGVRQPDVRGVEGAAGRARRPLGARPVGARAGRRSAGAANGYIGEVHLDGGPAYRLPAVPVQFDEQPPELRRAPEHGEHTEALLLELGYDWDGIAALKDAGSSRDRTGPLPVPDESPPRSGRRRPSTCSRWPGARAASSSRIPPTSSARTAAARSPDSPSRR